MPHSAKYRQRKFQDPRHPNFVKLRQRSHCWFLFQTDRAAIRVRFFLIRQNAGEVIDIAGWCWSVRGRKLKTREKDKR